jgi:uncharacterized protein (DUF2252 family)
MASNRRRADPAQPAEIPHTVDVAARDAEAGRAHGRAVRAAVPRRSLAGVASPDLRPDPIVILETQGRSRVQELLPIRYSRMAASPFAFLRGAAAIMAADLAAVPATGITVQLCGDAHIANFGVFATPERDLVFDINDFDETHTGPFEWDVKRLAASVAVEARERGAGGSAVEAVVRAAVSAYTRGIAEAAAMTVLDAWYHRLDLAAIFAMVEREARGRRSRLAAEHVRSRVMRDASRRTSAGSLDRLAILEDGAWRFREEPPLVRRHALDGETGRRVGAFYDRYLASLRGELRVLLSLYRPVDLARRVVGVGSVGTETFVLLLVSRRDDDVLFLQLKEAQSSTLAPFVDGPRVLGSPRIVREGERVVVGQRLMQAASDPFLGSAAGGRADRQSFYVRQLRDMKLSADIPSQTARVFSGHVRLCARALAFAHARSGTARAIVGYVGSGDAFVDAITAFAIAYADRTAEDHARLVEAIATGRLPAAPGI